MNKNKPLAPDAKAAISAAFQGDGYLSSDEEEKLGLPDLRDDAVLNDPVTRKAVPPQPEDGGGGSEYLSDDEVKRLGLGAAKPSSVKVNRNAPGPWAAGIHGDGLYPMEGTDDTQAPSLIDHLSNAARGAGRTLASIPSQVTGAAKNLVSKDAWKGVAADPGGTATAAIGGMADAGSFGLAGPEARLQRAHELELAARNGGGTEQDKRQALEELRAAQAAVRAQDAHPYVAGAAGLVSPLAAENVLAGNLIDGISGGSRLARAGKTAAAVGTASATGTAARSLVHGDNAGQAAENAAGAGLFGFLSGGVPAAVTEGAKATSAAIRSPSWVGGRDIALLESRGATASPVPFRPVNNAPSKQMGVGATSEGRGEVGVAGAEKMKDAIDARERHNTQRLNNVELPAAEAKHGERLISVEPVIAALEAEARRPGVEMLAGREGMLKKAIAIMRGELEPTALIHTPGVEFEKVHSPVHVETSDLDPNYGVHRRVPNEPQPGPHPRGTIYRHGEERRLNPDASQPEREVYEPLNSRRSLGMTEEDFTAHAGGGEPIEVGVGDVRGRVEKPMPGYEPTQPGLPLDKSVSQSRLLAERDAVNRMPDSQPNYVRSAKELNEIRRVFDEVAKAEKIAAGTDPANHPLYGAANLMRDAMREHAPAIALANRRYHDSARKSEVTRERMKDSENPNPESLGLQLAGQDEEGSKVAGVRKPRLKKLRENFPTDEIPKETVEAAFDDPRALLAEERMHFKKLPRIGGGGGDTKNWLEPGMARYVDPAARGLVKHGDRSVRGSAFFSEMADAARRRREEADKQ